MKIRIHPSFIVYITAISIFASLETSISALMALSIHEASHIIASKWFNERIEMLDLTPFWGRYNVCVREKSAEGLKRMYHCSSRSNRKLWNDSLADTAVRAKPDCK